MTNPLHQLLQRADALPADAPSNLADRLRTTAHRRRQIKGTVTGLALFLPVLALLFVPQPSPPRSPSIATLRAEADDFNREAEIRLAAVERMLAAEPQPIRAPATNPLLAIQHERERAAQILLHLADRYRTEFNQPDTASAEYRRILELFPDTHWASIARQRLDQLHSSISQGA